MVTLMQLNQLSIKLWMALGAAGCLILLSFLFLLGQKPVSIVVVDMTRAIQTPSLMLARSKLSQEAQLKIMNRFSALLPEVIKAYGKQHGVTVVSATVLASHNRYDITNSVISQTIARVKHES